MKIRLRERILFPILGLIILGMGMSIKISNEYAKDSISKITKKAMIQTVDNVTKNLDTWILKNKGIIETLSQFNEFSEATLDTYMGKAFRPEVSKILKEFRSKNTDFESIFITDKVGNVVASSKDQNLTSNINIRDREYFKKAMTNKPVISKAVISKFTQDLVFTITYPILVNDVPNGIISGVVKISLFTKDLKDLKIGKTGYLFICDSEGLAIYHPNPKVAMKANLQDFAWGKKAFQQKNGYIEYDWKGEPIISVFRSSKINGWFVVSRVLPKEIFASINQLKKINIIIAVITILTLSAAIILLTRFIILKPITLSVSFAKQIASGDLNARMDYNKKDELGDLISSLNGMGAKLGELFQIEELRRLVKRLSDNSSQLNDVSTKMNHDIEGAATRSTTVSTKSTEMTESIHVVAEAMEDGTANISAVAAGAEQMSSTINEIAENTEKTSSVTRDAVDKANEASTRINMLGTAADEIGKVTGAIKDISEQTNLLALNATIEAARAGDAGKGFAVVAGEIKELASQTAKATADIESKVKNIQGSTRETVVDINEIASTINEIDSFVTSIATAIEEQSVTTKEIAESVNQASMKISEVNSSMTGSAQAAAKITEDITGISEIAAQLKDGSIQVNQSSGDLAELSTRVNNLVSKFKI